MIPILERFEQQFSTGHPILVANAGLLSKSNIEDLTIREYKFILRARVKNESAKIVKAVEERYWQNGEMVEYTKPDGCRLIIEYTESHAKKDEFNRTRGLKKLKKQVNAGKLTKSNLNNRGYNKYLKMDGDISISIDYQKYENAIYTQVWCTLIAQLLLTITQKIAQAKKAFSVVASLKMIHLISMVDVNELLRSTRRCFKSKSIPPGLQLCFNIKGVVFNNKNNN